MKFKRNLLQSLPHSSAKGLHCIRPTTRITQATFHRKRNACEIHAQAWARTDFSGQRANGSGHRNSSAKYFWLTQMSELSTSSEAKRMGRERAEGERIGQHIERSNRPQSVASASPTLFTLCASLDATLLAPAASHSHSDLSHPAPAPCPHSLTVLKKLLKIACHAFYFHWAPQLLPSGQKKKN